LLIPLQTKTGIPSKDKAEPAEYQVVPRLLTPFAPIEDTLSVPAAFCKIPKPPKALI